MLVGSPASKVCHPDTAGVFCPGATGNTRHPLAVYLATDSASSQEVLKCGVDLPEAVSCTQYLILMSVLPRTDLQESRLGSAPDTAAAPVAFDGVSCLRLSSSFSTSENTPPVANCNITSHLSYSVSRRM